MADTTSALSQFLYQTLNNVKILAGSVAPENNVAAPTGSLYLYTGGGSATTLYIKESSPTDVTGWVGK